MVGYKISNIYSNDERLENLAPLANRCLRVEEVPPDEENLSDSEILIPVAHFYQVTWVSLSGMNYQRLGLNTRHYCL